LKVDGVRVGVVRFNLYHNAFQPSQEYVERWSLALRRLSPPSVVTLFR
jgi:hypothetical protein